MKNDKIKNIKQVSKISLSEKQSVRTTFKLTEDCINAVDWLLKTNNLKVKELFDFLCSNNNLVNLAAEAVKKEDKNISSKYIRKTFVISKRVLRLLNKKSEEYRISRDLVVEKLVLLFKELLEKHTKEEKQKEEKAFSIISDFWARAEEIETNLKDLLDDDNPILDRFGVITIIIMNLVNAIESKLNDDVPIDPDDYSQSC
ncbi:hypothetical protein GF406_21390 [candidate division KSB1 bacterium]|nr:hypothetical protein [candidate division KSB1 bacterium]